MPILDQNGAPTLVNVHQLERAIIDEQAGRSGSTRERRSDGRWYRARSFGWHGLVLRTRLRLAKEQAGQIGLRSGVPPDLDTRRSCNKFLI